jgi:hypothetical protein
MSLCISIVTAEGVVVAGDSRQTQTLGGMNRVSSESAEKVFALTSTVLAATAGWGFLKGQDTPNVRNIASLVEDFKPTIPAGSTVVDIASLMWAHFNTLYNNHIVAFPNAAVTAGQNALNFAVTGFDSDSRSAEMYNFLIPSENAPAAPVRTTDNPGSWWMGMVDVVSRIYNGVDFRAFNLPFVVAANAENNNANAATQQLSGLTYVVNWHSMGLQEAIDFAVGLIQITIMVQRFAAGIVNDIGGTANVGGPIDVAVVRNGGTVEWVQRKQLHI